MSSERRRMMVVDMDQELYRSVRVAASHTDRTIGDIVDEAVAHWIFEFCKNLKEEADDRRKK